MQLFGLLRERRDDTSYGTGFEHPRGATICHAHKHPLYQKSQRSVERNQIENNIQGVAYGSSVKEVEQALLTACQGCDYAVPEPAPSIRLVSYGDSAVQFEALVWIIQPEFRAKATDQINRAIGEEFEKRGIEMPFPQREVHIRSTT